VGFFLRKYSAGVNGSTQDADGQNFYPFPSVNEIKAKCVQHFKYGMDKELFRQLTQNLIKYNPRQERDVLIKPTTAKTCEYCAKPVVDQRITCEAYKLGTPDQHFKHKCLNCRCVIYDGSFKFTPRVIRPINYQVKSSVTVVTPPSLSKRGLVMGRPRKRPA
jgi:hypothetical protein